MLSILLCCRNLNLANVFLPRATHEDDDDKDEELSNNGWWCYKLCQREREGEREECRGDGEREVRSYGGGWVEMGGGELLRVVCRCCCCCFVLVMLLQISTPSPRLRSSPSGNFYANSKGAAHKSSGRENSIQLQPGFAVCARCVLNLSVFCHFHVTEKTLLRPPEKRVSFFQFCVTTLLPLFGLFLLLTKHTHSSLEERDLSAVSFSIFCVPVCFFAFPFLSLSSPSYIL